MFRSGSTHAQRKLMLRNTNGRRFADVGRQAGTGFARDGVGRTLVTGDIDNDGDLDLLITNNGGAVELLRNDGGTRLGAIEVRALTRGRDAVGARVTVMAGGETRVREVKSGSSYLGQNDLRAHLGLGQATRVEWMEIRWPDGRVERIDTPPINHFVTVDEGQGITKRVPFVRP